MNFKMICEVCGADYMAHRRTSMYCSVACRVKAFYLRKYGEPFKPLPENTKKKRKKQPASQEPKPVNDFSDNLPVEPVFIRKFMNFHGVMVYKQDVRELLSDICEANDAGRYSIKDEPYGKRINYVYKRLDRLVSRVGIWPLDFRLTQKDKEMLGSETSDYLH